MSRIFCAAETLLETRLIHIDNISLPCSFTVLFANLRFINGMHGQVSGPLVYKLSRHKMIQNPTLV
jgi:hypothetical protein